MKKVLIAVVVGVLCLSGYALAQKRPERPLPDSVKEKITGRIEGLQKVKAEEPVLVSVQGGTFTMGCTPEHYSVCNTYQSNPKHQVTVGDFRIGKYEVTQYQWDTVMNPSAALKLGAREKSKPVTDVTWNDVQEYISKLNAQTGKKYRLPTEAEWEFAARGGVKEHRYLYSGSNTAQTVAWTSENFSGTMTAAAPQQVGTKAANELGIYDMSGNVWEWVQDWYGQYSDAAQTNPTGPSSGDARVIRSGSVNQAAKSSNVTSRASRFPGSNDWITGFRVAMDK
ncbi:MAG: formylglycine-generating enzyme family protein [Acidobacteriota bacterium]|jgi:formylglycine-generating enzyme required for sulfatase activity|nr:formylglycine-generating enzyme family protein [Acidobacteriota bacterium]